MALFVNLSTKEKEVIEELKKRTIHELTPWLLEDDTLYYRFLKARDFNLKNAESLLKKHLSDRKIYGMEEVLNGKYIPPEHLTVYIPYSILGYDKEGSIVRYYELGKLDYKGIYTLYSIKQVMQYSVSLLEKDFQLLREQSKKLGKPIFQMSVIFDMDEFSLYQATSKKGMEVIITGVKLLQDNYPERIKHVFIINASNLFYIALSTLKPVLASALFNKFRIFGRNGWKDALLKEIDDDVLPAFLGGNRTDPDGNPMCNSFILHGKPMPVELYMKKPEKTLSQEEGVKKLSLTRGDSSKICLYIYEPHTCIEWEFETKTRDIGFGLYYKDNFKESSKLEELIPKQRIDTTFFSETGLFKCDKTGMYIIEFDNSFSWIYSKDVYYRIRLSKPQY